MANNVFGNPITDQTLEGMAEYVGKQITRTDKAHVALNMKNAANKAEEARQYVDNLKKQWGSGASTFCLIYNATGDPVTFITSHDYFGHIGPGPYPVVIANGQWGAFLHVKTYAALAGSCAAVVYRGKNQGEVDCDWILAWSNPFNTAAYDNKVYTEILEARNYDGDTYWDHILGSMDTSGQNDNADWNGCLSKVSTGMDTSPVFEAIMTLKNA